MENPYSAKGWTLKATASVSTTFSVDIGAFWKLSFLCVCNSACLWHGCSSLLFCHWCSFFTICRVICRMRRSFLTSTLREGSPLWVSYEAYNYSGEYVIVCGRRLSENRCSWWVQYWAILREQRAALLRQGCVWSYSFGMVYQTISVIYRQLTKVGSSIYTYSITWGRWYAL